MGLRSIDQLGDGVAKRHDPGATVFGVLDDDGLERRQGGEAVRDGVADGVGHGASIDGAEIEQRPQDVRAGDPRIVAVA